MDIFLKFQIKDNFFCFSKFFLLKLLFSNHCGGTFLCNARSNWFFLFLFGWTWKKGFKNLKKEYLLIPDTGSWMWCNVLQDVWSVWSSRTLRSQWEQTSAILVGWNRSKHSWIHSYIPCWIIKEITLKDMPRILITILLTNSKYWFKKYWITVSIELWKLYFPLQQQSSNCECQYRIWGRGTPLRDSTPADPKSLHFVLFWEIHFWLTDAILSYCEKSIFGWLTDFGANLYWFWGGIARQKKTRFFCQSFSPKKPRNAFLAFIVKFACGADNVLKKGSL